jgi:hypothetical protein
MASGCITWHNRGVIRLTTEQHGFKVGHGILASMLCRLVAPKAFPGEQWTNVVRKTDVLLVRRFQIV